MTEKVPEICRVHHDYSAEEDDEISLGVDEVQQIFYSRSSVYFVVRDHSEQECWRRELLERPGQWPRRSLPSLFRGEEEMSSTLQLRE